MVVSFALNLLNCFHTAIDSCTAQTIVAFVLHAAVHDLASLRSMEKSFDSSNRRPYPKLVHAHDSFLNLMAADEWALNDTENDFEHIVANDGMHLRSRHPLALTVVQLLAIDGIKMLMMLAVMTFGCVHFVRSR